MGDHINLNTTGTQCIGAYLAKPKGPPKGGIVVVQEIFGVNQHMRNVTDRFAELGYVAIAPAFSSIMVESGCRARLRRGRVQARPRACAGRSVSSSRSRIVASAAESIRSAGRIGCVGYCWGGTVALASRRRASAMPAVSYYGARNVKFPRRAAEGTTAVPVRRARFVDSARSGRETPRGIAGCGDLYISGRSRIRSRRRSESVRRAQREACARTHAGILRAASRRRMSTRFVLDSRLEGDTHAIGDLPLSELRLMDDARFPWLILVPRIAGARDLIDLDERDQRTACSPKSTSSAARWKRSCVRTSSTSPHSATSCRNSTCM